MGQQAKPAESDFRKELLKRADRVEAEAEKRSLAQRDGRVGIGDAEKDRQVIDARAGVQDLHDEPLGARLVDELELPPFYDQKLLRPLALAEDRRSPWIVATGGKATKRLDVVAGQTFEAPRCHRRAQPGSETRAGGPRLPLSEGNRARDSGTVADPTVCRRRLRLDIR